MAVRKKLSTTIGAESYLYLNRLVKAGKVRSVGEAVDFAVERARRLENRARLALDTTAYFENLSRTAAEEEARLEAALSSAAAEVDFDRP